MDPKFFDLKMENKPRSTAKHHVLLVSSKKDDICLYTGQ